MDGTLMLFEARPGLLTMSSSAAERLVDPLKGPSQEGRDAIQKDLRPTFVQSVVVWGVGMDHVASNKIAEVSKGAAGSSSQIEGHQIRVSLVDTVASSDVTVQHQRELRAVPEEEMSVEWDATRAQLKVHFLREGGLQIRGDQALEVDWTEALVA
jgi:hypothetical protein